MGEKKTRETAIYTYIVVFSASILQKRNRWSVTAVSPKIVVCDLLNRLTVIKPTSQVRRYNQGDIQGIKQIKQKKKKERMNIFRSKRSAEPTMSDITNDNEGTSIFGGKAKAPSNGGQRRALGDITNAVQGTDGTASQGLASKANRYSFVNVYFS